MRKIISILLLFTLCFSLYGYHLFFGVQTAHAKSQMKQFLRTQKHHAGLEVFHFTMAEANSLQWEDAQEFQFQGKMYDVLEQIFRNGQVTIHCIQDEKETALLNEFLKTTKNSRQASVMQLLVTPFVLPRIEMPQPNELPISVSFKHPSFHLGFPDVSILIPPPRQA